MHEAELHDANSFVTLTYAPDQLPYKPGAIAPTIVKRDHQLFLKRLRKLIHPIKIRYMGCGEYGENTERPHYHDIIFGYDFPDRELHDNRGSNPLYTSELLSRAWPHGLSVIGDVTFESAAYVASYTVKKLNGPDGKRAYYEQGREPPCGFMSLKPGIGRGWIEKNVKDVMCHDAVIVRGHKQRPPRAYLEFFEQNGGDVAAVIRRRQKLAAERLDKNLVASGATQSIVMESTQNNKIKKL